MIFYGFKPFHEHVKMHGIVVPSRYGDTRELVNCGVSFVPGAVPQRNRANYGIGWQEVFQLLAGDFAPDHIARVAPKANLELFTAQMAYGPRVKDQLPQVVDLLRREPESRQAIVFIGSPDDGPTSCQPCTSTVQFLRREGMLLTRVSMRSWDLVKGMTYDVMMFGALAQLVAYLTKSSLGLVHVSSGSTHVYVSDNDVAYEETHRMFMLSFPNVDGLDAGDAMAAIRMWARMSYKAVRQGHTPDQVQWVPGSAA